MKDLANELFLALRGKLYDRLFPGMEKMFRLRFDTTNVQKITIASYTEQELERAGQEIRTIKAENPDRAVLAVLLELSREEQDRSAFKSYYFAKHMCNEIGVPLQVVTRSRIIGRDSLKWSVANIALQMFCKLGGWPWQVVPTERRTLIFGLGSAHRKDDEGSIVKYLAYAVCLDSSGIYQSLDLLGQSNERETYLSQFEDRITHIISGQLGQFQDTVQVVVHVPFLVRREELQKIENSLNRLRDAHSSVQFICIKVSTENRFFGYAENNSLVPYESTCVRVAGDQFLLWLEGLHYGKEVVSKRMAGPVHVKFVYPRASDLTSDQKRALLQDIINLSGANWRGFNAKLAPISIYYPQLVAHFLSQFELLDADGEEEISQMDAPWFL